MTRTTLLFFILAFMVSGNSWPEENKTPKLDLKNAWFKPSLAVNN